MLQDRKCQWDSIFRLITIDPARSSVSAKEISGKSVLITGAGGSIGSTLAHEIGGHSPGRIILLDASEQSLYRIDRDLELPHSAILGSVCDRALLDDLLERHRPQVIFHAAAFKHVPLMEFNPFAALQNNAIGTFILAQSAVKYRVEQLVMVSTDKAVAPASIMGASKRIAKLVLLAMPSSATQLKAVRLGNVLASEGSVLPLFQSQIDRAEALSVTHPEASRYFLTMQYAAQLLLLALSDEFAPGILVPELGEPIRIEEIARRMLAGSNGAHQSHIVFTGLRPGDKLCEKLLSNRESFLDNREAPLRPIHSESPLFSELHHTMNKLEQAVQERNLPELLSLIFHLVPDYEPSEVIQAALQEHAATRCDR
jgi:FlaA1/EpsC-like NDP-sugar epimerase